MIKSLYVRVVLTFLAAITIGLLSSFILGLLVFEKEIDEVGQNDMTASGLEIIRVYKQTAPEDPDTFMNSMVALTAYPVQLFLDSGETRKYAYQGHEFNAGVAPEPVRKVLAGEVYRSTAHDDITFVGLPFQFEGKKAALFVQSSSKNEGTIVRLVLTILLLVLITGSLCILIAARYLVKPLKDLTKATQRLATGDFDVELKLKRKDELGTLAQSFNRMTNELKQLETMRQDFVSNVSHEIQSPLTSISGFVKALKDNVVDTEAGRSRYLDIIWTESERLSRMSDNLLKLASLESNHHPFETATFNLDEQIRRVAVSCEPLWTVKNIDLELQLPPAAVPITADQDQLNQVWVNLLSNSIKFTPEGGWIRIGMSRGEDDYTVAISDSGCGIAPEELEHIFERFYKTDRSRNRSGRGSGSGLGLAIVKKIVELHHGTIEASSKPGHGTTIIVSLPAGAFPVS